MKRILSILVPKQKKSPGMATEQQPVFMIVSTDKENEYPKYIKLSVIPVDNKNFIHKFFHMRAKISTERVLNTDGKTTFSDLSKELTLKSEKIVYSETEHRLKWLDIIAGNIKNNIVGIYHGVTKRSLPLFLQSLAEKTYRAVKGRGHLHDRRYRGRSRVPQAYSR